MLITSKDGQTATGDWATFDVKANTVLLGGHVVVTRGKDVAEGPRLKIDLTTGMYRFEVEERGRRPGAAPVVRRRRPADAVQARARTPTRANVSARQAVLLFYPKEAKDRAKGGGQEGANLPGMTARAGSQHERRCNRAGEPNGPCGALGARKSDRPRRCPQAAGALMATRTARQRDGSRRRRTVAARLAHRRNGARRAIAAAWSSRA